MSNKTDLKTEILVVSNYCNIIMQIINVHKQLSVNKTMLFAFLLKDQCNYYNQFFSSNSTNDIVIKAISLISGKYNEYCKNIKYIIEAIDLLISHEDIALRNNILFCQNESESKYTYNNKFIKKAIEESRKFSDRQILKEVINNV